MSHKVYAVKEYKFTVTPTPADSGFAKLYFKSDGVLYKMVGSTESAITGSGTVPSNNVVGPATTTPDNIPQWDSTTNTLKDGLAVVTTIGSTGSDINIPTEKAVRDAMVTAGTGDVTGPTSSVDSNIVAFNGTTGKIIKDSGKTLPSGDVIGASDVQTITNKTISADDNTISNLEIDNFKTGVIDTDLTSTSTSDDTLASAKAVKDYVDSQVVSASSKTVLVAASGGDYTSIDAAISAGAYIIYVDGSTSHVINNALSSGVFIIGIAIPNIEINNDNVFTNGVHFIGCSLSIGSAVTTNTYFDKCFTENCNFSVDSTGNGTGINMLGKHYKLNLTLKSDDNISLSGNFEESTLSLEINNDANIDLLGKFYYNIIKGTYNTTPTNRQDYSGNFIGNSIKLYGISTSMEYDFRGNIYTGNYFDISAFTIKYLNGTYFSNNSLAGNTNGITFEGIGVSGEAYTFINNKITNIATTNDITLDSTLTNIIFTNNLYSANSIVNNVTNSIVTNNLKLV